MVLGIRDGWVLGMEKGIKVKGLEYRRQEGARESGFPVLTHKNRGKGRNEISPGKRKENNTRLRISI